MIVALFVETNGCYSNDKNIDSYGIERDAKTYTGNERNKPTLSKKEANATPVEFKKELIRLVQLNQKLQKN